MTDIAQILEERGSRYGNSENVSNAYFTMKDAFYEASKDSQLGLFPGELQMYVDMVIMKLARMVSGDPYYKDNWTDIVGYAKLAEKYIEKVTGGPND